MSENAPEQVQPPTPVVKKYRWLRNFLKALGIGVGVGVGLGLVAAFFVWRNSRPKPPKPWDTKAITAEYEYIDTFGPTHHLSFCYALQNNTDVDYNLDEYGVTHLEALLAKENGIEESPDFLKGVYPEFIPARGRSRFCMHVEYPSTVQELPADPTDDQRKRFHEDLEKFASKQFGNLKGFELFDDGSRYEIVFPSGWRDK